MIPREDYIEQGLIYKRKTYPPSRWRIIGYFQEPTIVMENIDTKEREYFGISGATAEDFEPVSTTKK